MSDHPPSSALRLPKSLLWIAGAVVAWFAVSEAATEVWYRWREAQAPVSAPWSIDFPVAENAKERGFLSFNEQELGSIEQELLHFDKAKSAAWRDSSGNSWTAFYLEWEADKRLNQTDLAHNPTSCLPAAGLKLVSSEPDFVVEAGGEPIRFRSWIFATNETPVYVFTATRRERELQRFDHEGDRRKKFLDKLSKPWFGNRSNPLQTLQFVVVGPNSMDGAREALAEQVRKLGTGAATADISN